MASLSSGVRYPDAIPASLINVRCACMQKYKYLDSLDPERTAGMWGYTDIKPPEKGDPRWPRMQIENRCYQSSVFRKLHIELAHRQDGLQVRECTAMHYNWTWHVFLY